jgi:hypothetical protein
VSLSTLVGFRGGEESVNRWRVGEVTAGYAEPVAATAASEEYPWDPVDMIPQPSLRLY